MNAGARVEVGGFGRWGGRSVLVTGHTGFKGSWLCALLARLGARVTGLALDPPTQPAHWPMIEATFASDCDDRRGDIRDAAAVSAALAAAEPEIVFHLAAQPLVRRGYRSPIETFEVNAMGTARLLDAVRDAPSVRAVVVVTTDKCYDNPEHGRAFVESDPLGGHDPYSASKACAELVAACWRSSFLASRPRTEPVALATARAGNVIGGGDWAEDRLVPDLIRGAMSGRVVPIRRPASVRPWQHVLEPLGGYLLLGARLLDGDARAAGAWNFGPAPADHRRVEEVVARLSDAWPRIRVRLDCGEHPHEAASLRLDASRARDVLGWSPAWNVDDAAARTAAWYRAWYEHGELRTARDIDDWLAAAGARAVRGAPVPQPAEAA